MLEASVEERQMLPSTVKGVLCVFLQTERRLPGGKLNMQSLWRHCLLQSRCEEAI